MQHAQVELFPIIFIAKLLFANEYIFHKLTYINQHAIFVNTGRVRMTPELCVTRAQD